MEIIGIVISILFGGFLIFYGAFALYAGSIFGDKTTGIVGICVLLLGLFVEYQVFSNYISFGLKV